MESVVADQDLQTMVREFRTSVSADLEAAHRRIDEFSTEIRHRITTAETAILNEIRDLDGRLDRRLERLEVRMTEVDARLTAIEGASTPE
jgi:hypothetical protein